jgi:uncharacterized protein (DUF2236 family)
MTPPKENPLADLFDNRLFTLSVAAAKAYRLARRAVPRNEEQFNHAREQHLLFNREINRRAKARILKEHSQPEELQRIADRIKERNQAMS